jgi:formylglycine-generating enzyme required for sulfatase activity/tRNA A-37 threonylcarbamoyl transferase component Bud32
MRDTDPIQAVDEGIADGSAGGEPVPVAVDGRYAATIRVIADTLSRRARGELVTDAQVIATHPELMPQLVEELDGLRVVQRAFAAGRKAGPIAGPLPALPFEAIDRPILPGEAVGPGAGEDVDLEAPARLAITGYTIVREVSTGGQATVYKAVQESTGRTVAIKVLPGGALARSVDRARFDREAEILAALDHPNIVSIVDRGRTPDGSFYFVMQYVDGRPLDHYADGCRACGVEGVLRLLATFAKVARAVGEAHARGIVHRDLKPSNLLVDARGEPHLLDFGLASVTAGGGAGDAWRATPLTAAGEVIGSLPWLSPEQVSGTASPQADPRWDVYGLGVCLYRCLTGRHPFRLDGAIPDVIDRIRFEAPPRPERAPGLDGAATEFVLHRCLSKYPPNRYPDAAPLADDLDALRDGRPIAAAAVAARRRFTPKLRTTLCVVLLLAACTTWLAGSGRKPTLAPTVFNLPATRNTLGMTLVRVPAGEFFMGTPANANVSGGDDERCHFVRITRPFCIGTCEVTRAQYHALMPSQTPDAAADSDLPITGVTWEEASEFCRRLSKAEGVPYRLPTEAEWEYACRAGTGEAWSGTGVPGDMGWTSENSGGKPHAVGQKKPNSWGLYDMHGNAAELCVDGYNWGYPPTEDDPVFRDGSAGHVVRGGSFIRPVAESRSAARAIGPRSDGGFRVVREQPAKPASK